MAVHGPESCRQFQVDINNNFVIMFMAMHEALLGQKMEMNHFIGDLVHIGIH